jgi:antitoxin MazE
MRTTLRKVGNSHGIIIPATLLAACEMRKEVDVRLEGKNLIIAPIDAPRTGWFEGYQAETDTEVFTELSADDSEDWVW